VSDGLLSANLLGALLRLRLNPRGRRTARGRGERLTGRGGTSTDLADYRDYSEGDDLRAIDWNAFARLQRPYLRLYRLEEDRHLVVLVDASASMAEAGKLARAKELAAALGAIGLASGDRVSLWCFGAAGDPRRQPPLRGLAMLPRWLAACAAIMPSTQRSPSALVVTVCSARLPAAISPNSERPTQAADPLVAQRSASLWLTLLTP